ncbi:hypothetical protein A3E95_02190 [Candidatus Nomurabacteria bacterium RIFCSPHIGHO2_12_FULL_44_22b]|nr:MAG: hypothetical protein A3E95_02190 [Candidatus Nomurabacteria bacterium RIFCSPHIGHO2_12_FULL_44_22b]
MKNMAKKKTKEEVYLDGKFGEITNLLQQLVAVQLYRSGAIQSEIATNLGIAIGTVNKLVKGVKSQK